MLEKERFDFASNKRCVVLLLVVAQSTDARLTLTALFVRLLRRCLQRCESLHHVAAHTKALGDTPVRQHHADGTLLSNRRQQLAQRFQLKSLATRVESSTNWILRFEAIIIIY